MGGWCRWGLPCWLPSAGGPGLSPGLSRGHWSKATTYLRPDSMNLSYSTAILQHRAWRVCTAEQLVLMTWLPVGRGKRGRREGQPTAW